MNDPRPVLGISRRYLHDEVVERLRDLIRDGDIAPRSRLNENDLCARFGISRTPLREAIKILATEGLLDLLPNRGARVASISEKELDDMLEVLAGLEAMAGELACRCATEAEVATIAGKHRAMVEAWKREDEATYFRLNREIHEAIMAASRNGTLQGIYANISGRVQRTRYAAHKTPEQWRRAIDDHERMVEFLARRDGRRLARVMRDHIHSKRAIIAAAYGNVSNDAAMAAPQRTDR